MLIPIFSHGQGILVITRGPGKVHLLSYASDSDSAPHKGTTTTDLEGITRFLISHSYGYTKYAFFWEGAGQAFCTFGQDTNRVLVGTHWNAATCVEFGSPRFTTQNVSSYTVGAFNRDNIATCFIIPDDFIPPKVRNCSKVSTCPATYTRSSSSSVTSPPTLALSQIQAFQQMDLYRGLLSSPCIRTIM